MRWDDNRTRWQGFVGYDARRPGTVQRPNSDDHGGTALSHRGHGPNRRIGDLEAGQPSVGRSPVCHKRRGLLERQLRCDGACLHPQDSLDERPRRNRQRRLSCGDRERLPRSTTQLRDVRPQDGPGGARSLPTRSGKVLSCFSSGVAIIYLP